MAESYEPYHIPQQSRRVKLRITSQSQPSSLETHFQIQGCAGLLPLYDPSLLTPDLLTCAGGAFHHHPNLDHGCARKENEASHANNSVGFADGIINASSSSSVVVSDCNRAFDQSFDGGGSGGDVIVFKPEPLSLSLSSHRNHNDILPVEINLQRFGGYGFPPAAAWKSSVPQAVYTGYASVLKGSRFLKPVQQLLEEFCNLGCGIYSERIDDEDSWPLSDPTIDNLMRSCGIDDGGRGEIRSKKSMLISMLDEVYKKYKQYNQQLQAVVASFECVLGLGNAAPVVSLALKSLSKHFRCLKDAIIEQLQFANKTQGHVTPPEKSEGPRSGNSGRRSLCNNGFSEHHPPVWRPQRGLPERAVTVLRAWLFDHFLHPYPTDTDKLMLAKQTGLSRNQVSNWFINARVRLWKPMVEEIHTLETRQAQMAGSQNDHRKISNHGSNDRFPQNPSTSTQRFRESPSKKTQIEFPNNNTFQAGNEALSFSYGDSSVPALSNGNNVVSLTLGLHQSHGMGLSQTFPINGAQRFGLGGEGYVVMDGFEEQNRDFGRDVGGGHLLHDFVG